MIQFNSNQSNGKAFPTPNPMGEHLMENRSKHIPYGPREVGGLPYE